MNNTAKCCHVFYDSIALRECVHNNTGTRNDRKVKIVSFWTKDVQEYAAFGQAVNSMYAEHNKYSINFFDPTSSDAYETHDLRWNKVKVLLDAVSDQNSSAEYIMWVDADVIFLDMDFRIEHFFDRDPLVHLVFSSARGRTAVNTGTILVRKSDWSKQFLREWWADEGVRLTLSDQEMFDKIYTTRKKQDADSASGENRIRVSDAVLILPPDAINSDPPAALKLLPRNPVLHLMGEIDLFRVHVFRNALLELCGFIHGSRCSMQIVNSGDNSIAPDIQCDARSPGERLSPQLGVTADQMTSWTLDIYSNLYDEIFPMYLEKSRTGANGRRDCALMAKIVNRLYFFHDIMSVQNISVGDDVLDAEEEENAGDGNFTAYEEAVRNLKAVYEATLVNYRENKKLHEKQLKESGKILLDWPELMWLVLDMGRPLLSAWRGVTDKEKYHIARELLEILYGVYEIVDPRQQEAVYHQVAVHYKDMGIVYLRAGDIANGLKSIEISVNMSREIAAIYGEHVLVSSLTALGQALADVERFEDSLITFEEASLIAERNFGRQHDLVMEIRLNRAFVAFAANRFDDAEQLAREAHDLLSLTNRPENVNYLKGAQRLLRQIVRQKEEDDS